MKHLGNIQPGDKIQLIKIETLLKNGVIKAVETTTNTKELNAHGIMYCDTERPYLYISKGEIENYGKAHLVNVVDEERNYVIACDWRYVYPPSHILKVIRK